MTCFGLLVIMFCNPPEKPPASTFCQIAKPIYWTAGDTRLTKQQADVHNRKWKALCK